MVNQRRAAVDLRARVAVVPTTADYTADRDTELLAAINVLHGKPQSGRMGGAVRTPAAASLTHELTLRKRRLGGDSRPCTDRAELERTCGKFRAVQMATPEQRPAILARVQAIQTRAPAAEYLAEVQQLMQRRRPAAR